MSEYHLAKALEKLREQINAKWPNRSKASDGWIGDTAHSARKSDHNPDYSAGGVVRAIDVTAKGIDMNVLIAALKADSRTSYYIHKGIICGEPGFKPRKYTGSNAHNVHIHISVKSTKAAEDGRAWDLGEIKPATPSKPKPQEPAKPKPTPGPVKLWPEKTLPVNGEKTADWDYAWNELMRRQGYTDKSLTTRMQRWLRNLGDYKGLIEADHGRNPVFGPMLVTALQKRLRINGCYPAKYLLDGKRQSLTISGEKQYLNKQGALYKKK